MQLFRLANNISADVTIISQQSLTEEKLSLSFPLSISLILTMFIYVNQEWLPNFQYIDIRYRSIVGIFIIYVATIIISTSINQFLQCAKALTSFFLRRDLFKSSIEESDFFYLFYRNAM